MRSEQGKKVRTHGLEAIRVSLLTCALDRC